MFPAWMAILAAARRRQSTTSHQPTADDLRDALDRAWSTVEDKSDDVDQDGSEDVPDEGVACIGQPGQSVFAPSERVTLLSDNIAGVDGEEWIKTDTTVEVEERC